MKNIFDFEKTDPPILREDHLAEMAEKRKAKKAALVTAIAGVAAEALLVLLGFLLMDVTALLSVLVFAYAAAGILGAALLIPTILVKRRHRRNGYN